MLSLLRRSPALARVHLTRRLTTTTAPPPLAKRLTTYARYTGYFVLSAASGVFLTGAAFFVHDAFTYTDKHVERVPINPLALHPERGGPKNLPIVSVLMDDEDDDENKKLSEKPRLVIVGGGWGVGDSLV